MDYRDLEYATRAVVDLTNPLRDVELDTVARAADVAASVAEATRSVEATPNISDLASNLNGLATKSADLVARPLPVIQQPAWFDAASAFMGAWQPPLGALDGLVDGYQWARDGLSAATAAVGSVAQAADFLAQPMESAFMSTVTPVAGMMGSFTAAARVATDWKPALMQFSPPLEASFATRLSEIERTSTPLYAPRSCPSRTS